MRWLYWTTVQNNILSFFVVTLGGCPLILNRIRDVKIVVWVEYMKNYMYIRTLKKMIIVMTQIVLNIEDKSLLPGLRKILSNLKGVSIARASSTRKGTLSRAIEDVRKGNVTRVSSVSDLMAKLEE